jgi:hypothetical protein
VPLALFRRRRPYNALELLLSGCSSAAGQPLSLP